MKMPQQQYQSTTHILPYSTATHSSSFQGLDALILFPDSCGKSTSYVSSNSVTQIKKSHLGKCYWYIEFLWYYKFTNRIDPLLVEVRKSVIIASFNVPLLKIIPIATRTFCQSIVLFFT